MAKLTFPGAITPTDTNNQVNFSELETEDFTLKLIQSNISRYTRGIARLLTQKDKYFLFAHSPTPTQQTTTNGLIPFILQQNPLDEFDTYNLTPGLFTAPTSTVFELEVVTVVTSISGGPAVLYCDIVSSGADGITTLGFSPIGNIFYVDISFPLILEQGDTLNFNIRTNISNYTLGFAASRLYISWR